MADSGVKEAEAAISNLILDEVTGEKVSKSEYKRRQKNREKDAKKKEKEAAAPPKAEKQKSTEDEELDLAPNVSSYHRMNMRQD
jgi:lysyl-tRNA synthetase class 2